MNNTHQKKTKTLFGFRAEGAETVPHPPSTVAELVEARKPKSERLKNPTILALGIKTTQTSFENV
jgi:hypothetical protein